MGRANKVTREAPRAWETRSQVVELISQPKDSEACW